MFCNNACKKPENLKITGENRKNLKETWKNLKEGGKGWTEEGGGVQSVNTLLIPRNSLKQKAAVTKTDLCTKRRWGGGTHTPPPSSSQNNPNISKVATCSEKGGGMDEIWGRGQKIYENHIQFDPQITEQYARIKLKYGQD